MDETELIKTLQTRISNTISAPVKTSAMDDERPVPVVIIADWDTKDQNYHNSAWSGHAVGDFDNDGDLDYEWYLNFSFVTRVEFSIRHYDEVEVSRLKENVKKELRLISENPQQFHSDLKDCILGSGGNPTNQFTEPKEAELMVSARFKGDHTITRTPGDDVDLIRDDDSTVELEGFSNNFTFN